MSSDALRNSMADSPRAESEVETRDVAAPWFLDFEASGLGTDGFPIQVAWGRDGRVAECWLIRPEPAWRLDEGWDPAAERIHGIHREQLPEGRPAEWVAARMNAQLRGASVYADGLPYDRIWLDQLFACSGQACEFLLEDFDELIYRVASPHMLHRVGWREQLRALAVARLKGLQWHQADSDVRRLMEMYRIAASRR